MKVPQRSVLVESFFPSATNAFFVQFLLPPHNTESKQRTQQ
jgi:hypothetical protein